MFRPAALFRAAPARAASVAVLLFALAGSLHAADYTWIATADGNWDVNTNWSSSNGGTTFPVAGDNATFSDPAAFGNRIVYLNGAKSAASLSFTNTGTTTIQGGVAGTGATNTLTLTNGLTVASTAGQVRVGITGAAVTNTLNGSQSFVSNNGVLNPTIADPTQTGFGLVLTNGITGTGADRTVTLDGTGSAISLGVIANGAGVTSVIKNGTGLWELDGSNTFTGSLTLNNGSLWIRSSNSLGVAARPVFLNGGLIAAVNGTRTIPAAVSFSIGGDIQEGLGITLGSRLDIQGNVTFTGGAHTLTFNNASTWNTASTAGFTIDLGGAVQTFSTGSAVIFNNPIVNGGITKTGTSTLQLGATTGTTYSGPTTVSGGTLQANGSAANGAGVFSPNSAYTVTSAGTLNMAGWDQTIQSLSEGGSPGGQLLIGNGTAGILTLGADNLSTTFTGRISGNGNGNSNGSNGKGGLVKLGTGTFTLGGANIHNGALTASGGVVSIPTLADGAIGGRTMTTTTGSPTATVSDVTGLQVGMTVANSLRVPVGTTISAIDVPSNTITMSANATGLNTATDSANFGFANSLGLATNVPGRLVLNGGTLQYTGPTVSTDRLFTLTQNGGGIDASGSGPVTFAGNTSGGTNAIAFGTGSGARTLTLSGTNTGNNTLAPIVGDGTGGATGVTKSGPGTWVLSGANTYTGPTAVNGGTLSVTGAIGGPGGVMVASGTPFGTLTGTGSIAGPVTVNAGPTAAQNGVISPGTSANPGLSTLTLGGGLTLPGTYNVTIDPASTASGLLNISGLLDLSGPNSTLNVSQLAGTPTGTYTLANYSSLLGTFAFTNLPANYGITYGSTAITISPTPVPEPASIMVTCGAAAGVGWWRRRKAAAPA